MVYDEKILIVDDDRRMCDSLKALLCLQGYETQTCSNGHDAIACLGDGVFDLVLLDIAMEEMDGFQVIERMSHKKLDAIVIIMTGYASADSAVEALRKGAYDYLRKPFEPEELLMSVKNAFYQKRLNRNSQHAKRKLKKTEERFRLLAENAKDMIYWQSLPDGRYEYISPACIEITGYTPEEICKKPMHIRQSIHPDWADYLEKQWDDLKTGKMPRFYEFQIIHKSGEVRWLHQRNKLICDDNGHPKAFEGVVSDITERKRAEEELITAKEFAENLLETANTIVITLNSEAQITVFNRYARTLTGYENSEVIGKNWFDLFIPPRDRETIPRIFEEALKNMPEVSQHENYIVIKSGEERLISWRNNILRNSAGHIDGVLAIGMDITERSQMEARLQQTQKMEAISTLAGGIAHQFNNALSVITGNMDMLEMDFPGNEGITCYANNMKASARRMTQLTAQLMAYARGGRYQAEAVSLAEFVKDSIPIVKKSIDPALNVVTDLPINIFKVKADRVQMQMVLSAVFINAAEAMDGNGCIRVACRNEIITEQIARGFPGLKTGAYACLTITDDGEGMDEETRMRVFDPFFTTKFVGRGLGLAAAYGFVKNHDGYIMVDSELGQGTIVKIYLPASERATS